MPKKSKLILIFIGIALISFFVNIKFKGHSICLFYNIFGLPCPSCGMTRSYLHLFHLDFKGAFHFHPLFWAVPFLLIFYKNKKIFYTISAIFIVVWIIRLFLFFPTTPPLDFNDNAVFPKVYRMFK